MSKRGFFVVAGFAGAAITIAIVALSGPGEKVRTVSGRIKSIDAVSRTASLEVAHPKTGQTLLLDGRVPLDCDIRIDGRPATLADLQPGEQVEVEGIIHRDRSLSANRVRATRAQPAAATSQPASSVKASAASSAPVSGQPPSTQAAPKHLAP